MNEIIRIAEKAIDRLMTSGIRFRLGFLMVNGFYC